MINKRFISIVLVISAVLLLFSLSAVSAGTYNLDNSNTTSDIQNVIDTDIDDEFDILWNKAHNLDILLQGFIFQWLTNNDSNLEDKINKQVKFITDIFLKSV